MPPRRRTGGSIFPLALVQTSMCRRAGTTEGCKFYNPQTSVADGCWFAHDVSELRCKTFAKKGACPNGDTCTNGLHVAAGVKPTDDVLYAHVASKGDRPERITIPFERNLPKHKLPSELNRQIATCKKDAVEKRSGFLGQTYLGARYRVVPSFMSNELRKVSTIESFNDSRLYDWLYRNTRFKHKPQAQSEIPIADVLQHILSYLPRLVNVSRVCLAWRERVVALPQYMLLNPKSPKAYLRHHLEVEFAQARSDMRRYDIQNCIIPDAEYNSGARRYLFRIDCPGLAERRPSLLRGDTIMARDNVTQQVHRGYIHFVQLDHLQASFQTTNGGLRTAPTKSFHVVFKFTETNYHRQFLAIENASTHFAFNDPIFQVRHDDPNAVRLLTDLSRTLNAKQKEACARIALTRPVTGSLGVFLLHGPPGTGKTTTLVSAMAEICLKFRRDKILVVAPSNMAANLICERIITMYTGINLLRVCSLSYDVAKECSPKLLPYTDSYQGRILSPHLVHSAQVVVTTVMSSGLLYGLGVAESAFHHIIVDEAGQTTEPELLVPLFFANRRLGTRITLAGDHKQLGAILRSKACEAFDFGRSTLERLISNRRIRDAFSVQLTDSYRAHPAIMELYNTLTYEGTLQAFASPSATGILELFFASTHPFGLDAPMRFMHVEGHEDREADSPSWFNQKEVVEVIRQIDELLRSRRVQPQDIVVLSPYMKQCKKITGILHQKFSAISEFGQFLDGPYDRRVPPIQVCSVEAFQGREAKVIIMSCVRSKEVAELSNDLRQSIGFLKQPKRLNVAISRPIAGLIIIGNAGVLQHDPSWDSLLKLLQAKSVVTMRNPVGTALTVLSPESMRYLKSLYQGAYSRGNADGAMPSYATDGEWRLTQ